MLRIRAKMPASVGGSGPSRLGEWFPSEPPRKEWNPIMMLGNSLFHARKKAGLTQEEVAERLGVSRQTIGVRP